jgi:hypothetical protein
MRFGFLAALVALLLAGAALAAATDPVERHTKVDMAKARATMLRAADLGPGWKSVPVNEDADCRSFHPDESDLVETGEANRIFDAGGARVASSATVFRTEAQARASWRRTVKPAAMRCALEGLREGLPVGQTVRVVELRRFSFPRLTPRTAGLRLIARVGDVLQRVNVHMDVVALGRGRTLAALLVVSVGQPVPAAAERQLAGLIASRMPR